MRVHMRSKILGTVMLLSALPKLLSATMAVDNFVHWGLGDEGRYAVGVLELLLGLGLFVAKTRTPATLGVTSVASAAVLVHFLAHEVSMLPMPLVVGAFALHTLVKDGGLRLFPDAASR